eukprot:11202051-Lingulodinium_polyedra.AAC.1
MFVSVVRKGGQKGDRARGAATLWTARCAAVCGLGLRGRRVAFAGHRCVGRGRPRGQARPSRRVCV